MSELERVIHANLKNRDVNEVSDKVKWEVYEKCKAFIQKNYAPEDYNEHVNKLTETLNI